MGIEVSHLRLYVIQPTLQFLDLYCKSAENLVLGTAAQESKMGRWLRQVGGGPGKGIYQMEHPTHEDIWTNYLSYKPDLKNKILQFATSREDDLIWNLAYATAMVRVHYLRVSEPLPREDDIQGLAKYWKQYYNTKLGKGTTDEFVRNYETYLND
jgi:hypothetical protein